MAVGIAGAALKRCADLLWEFFQRQCIVRVQVRPLQPGSELSLRSPGSGLESPRPAKFGIPARPDMQWPTKGKEQWG